ncbi:transposase [Streptomyces olivoreticuli]
MDESTPHKGHVYGTIPVDIETRRPVDLLPGRSVATVAQWLAGHPNVEVICRDRSVAYAEARQLGHRTPFMPRIAGISGKTWPKPSRRRSSDTGLSCINRRRKPRPALPHQRVPRSSHRQYLRLREAFQHDDPPRRQLSARDVTSWITHHPDSLNTAQAQQLKDILARCPELDRAAGHVRTFVGLMNKRQDRQLHTFTTSLGQDLNAVVAGLSTRYSSGPIEGHNNKIKILKRQMLGRANFDLLRKQVLLAARGHS